MSTGETPDPDWSRRLRALERENQRLGGLVVLLVLVAIAHTVWHLMPGPGVVTAQRFVLKPPGAPPRGEFSLWGDGTPALRLNNQRGEARALWALRKDGTLSLRMSDTNFTTRVEMFVDPAGLPKVALYGIDGRSRAQLVVDETNRGELRLPQP